MGDQPQKELISSMELLFEDGNYSDLTVTCGNDPYRAHKAIVCPRSAFFASAISGPFKEAETGVIDLPDDDQQAVKMMMHYFYHLDYPQVPLDVELNALEDISMISSAQDIVDRPCEPEVDEDSWGGYVSMKKKKKAATNAKAAIPAAPAELACPPNFLVHAKVYAIAEKYAMEGLKALALQKFDQGARLDFEISDFVLGAKEAYTSTPDEIRPMRDAVVKVLGQRLSLFKTASVKQLLAKEQSLSYDVFMHLHG